MKIITLFFFSISLCYSQGDSDSTYYYFHHTTPKSKVLLKINSFKDHSFGEDYYKLIYFSKLKYLDSISKYLKRTVESKNIPENKSAKILYFQGFMNKLSDNDSLFLKYSNLAYKKATIINDSLTVLYSLSALSQSYDYTNDYPYNQAYLNLLEKKANEYNSSHFKKVHQFLNGNYYLFRDNVKKALSNYHNLLKNKFDKKDSTLILPAYNSMGVLFQTIKKNSDSAIYYYKKKIEFINASPSHQSDKSYFNTYINIANSYLSKNDLNNAESYYIRASNINIEENKIFYKSVIESNLSKLYKKKKNFELAFSHLKNYNKFNDSLKKEKQRIAIANIQEQYDNEKLRADNLEIESKRKQNQNLLIGALIFILFGGITAYLIQKNTKRKQKLAEQEKVLETQKLATVLKEQELMSIDAMIEGQEKERQRIANDLHDDLGGLMATVKLHFNVLKEKQTPELFNKTNILLDEAYQKIRSIAHAKNSGVIAKQGLLKAIQNMAEKISTSNKISIDVIDYGLEDRLENSLELTIFRIVQELATNIIKHAEATEATIHLTNHDESLNIMVEDNGKGFNPSQVTTKNKGMGISSIDKRIEHLNGTMTIESEPSKSTTIIIDIPL
ncbi:sensor histidine kinase [Flavivirga spongiicola]|uniref:Oxygen sensor histidine kinase NreB n=1 Tax=Flavivirga spongiicola TaxID=421621 RepID=A0ABU7XPX9_9FLAO|nr:sensor histidine kinase [Flavivirga sp. MEBiC05379]MDO5977591.1 sensor histidine kinase [Flavivirga sp. MEBiC05379]